MLIGLDDADEAAVRAELAGLATPVLLRRAGDLTGPFAEPAPDVILAGDRPGAPPIPQVIEALRRHGVDGFVVAVANWDESTARLLMRAGAADVVSRDRLARLGPIVERELRELDDRRRLRRAEAALTRSEANFRKLFEFTPDAMAVHVNGRFVWANSSQATLMGYPSAEAMIGHTILEHLEGDDAAAAINRMRLLGSGAPVGLREFTYVRVDHSRIDIEVSSLPFEFEGRPAILSVARDISERKRAQGRMLQSDRLAAIGKLAAGVAHEINNPLAYVIANVGAVQAEISAASADLRALHEVVPAASHARVGSALARLAEIDQALVEAAEGAERVRVIVRDLKTFARHEQTGTNAVDLKKVIEASINVAWNEIRHRARLVKTLDAAPPVEANESALGLLVVNLLLNAAASIPEGDADANEIRIRCGTDAQGRAELSVQDSGPGLRQEDLARVFEPFFGSRPDGAAPSLGLSVCHGIVGQLGGEIRAESAPGQGTTFLVSLPPHVQPAPALGRPAPTPKTSAAARVLVVDDEAAVGNALRRMLTGHDVTLVSSGRAALEILSRDRRFDVVLCDLMMAEMTGMDLFDEVSKQWPGFEKKMLFMTGGAFTERAQTFLGRVANTVLEKPFRRDELRALVAERVPGSAGAQVTPTQPSANA